MEDKKDKLEEIDWLKGGAILGTVLVHSFVNVEESVASPIRLLFLLGSMGCQLFFLISGFCLANSWEKGHNKLWRFYYRRFVGIAPAYYLMIIFYIALNIVLKHEGGYIGFQQNTNGEAIINNILLIHGFLQEGHNDVVPGGWYIGVSCFFYLIFPFVARKIEKVGDGNKQVLLVFGVFIIGQVVVRYIVNNQIINTKWERIINCEDIIYNLPVFLMGIVLFQYYNRGILYLNGNQRKICSFIVIGLALATIIDYYFSILNHQFTSGLFFCSLFIWLISGREETRKQCKCLACIGKASYAIYFVHIPFLCYILPVLFMRINPLKCKTFIFLVLVLMMLPLIVGTGMLFQKVIDGITKRLIHNTGRREK